MSEDQSPRVIQFLKEVNAVCRKFGFSISHEDGHGAFRVVPYSFEDSEWLSVAVDESGTKGGES